MVDRVQLGEQTKKQTGVSIDIPFLQLIGGDGALRPALPASYDTYRQMQKQPTIALALALGIAPVTSAKWAIEEDNAPKGAYDLIDECLMPIREPFIECALLGGALFGWQPFEKVFDRRDEMVILRKLKPLLQDITDILVDRDTGAFTGFKQRGTLLRLENSLLINFRVEGTQWYGRSLLENARDSWNTWRDASEGASRYDRKLAGSHYKIRVPLGENMYNGQMRPTGEIAKEIAQGLKSSGTIIIPDVSSPYGESTDSARDQMGTWDISMLEDKSARQPTFIDRLNYLDKLMVRALLLPERAVLEGQYGTKAEAAEHISLAMTQAELTHRHITRLLNWHVVDQLLALNYGEQARGSIQLVASPIVDTKLKAISELYKGILANPAGFLEEYGNLDMREIRDSLDIPQTEKEQTANEPPFAGMDTGSPASATVARLYRDLRGENVSKG